MGGWLKPIWGIRTVPLPRRTRKVRSCYAAAAAPLVVVARITGFRSLTEHMRCDKYEIYTYKYEAIKHAPNELIYLWLLEKVFSFFLPVIFFFLKQIIIHLIALVEYS